MLYSFFGTNRPVVLVFLLLPAFGYGILAYCAEPVATQDLQGPLFTLLYQFLGASQIAKIGLGIGLHLVSAVMINQLCNSHHFNSRENYLPALVYFMLVASHLSWSLLNPISLGLFFFLLSQRRLLTLFRASKVTGKLYDAGFFMALAVLSSPILLILVPVIWLSLSLLRPFSAREYLVPLLGLATPAAYTWAYYWWFKYDLDLYEYVAFTGLSAHTMFGGFNPWQYGFVFFTSLLMLIGLGGFVSEMRASTVHKKNTKGVLLLSGILLTIAWIYGSALDVNQTGLAILLGYPLAVFMSFGLSATRKPVLISVLFYIWFGLSVLIPIYACVS